MLLVVLLATAAAAQQNAETKPSELELSQRLIAALERENAALKQRLDTEKTSNALLTELNETRKSEAESLRQTIAAKNEALAAKDAVIAAQDTLIASLKQKKTSVWKRIGDIAIGVIAGAAIR